MEKERQDKKKVTRARKTREERQEDIICAALEIFWKDGFWEARMDDIAAEAGVAKGTLYLYFASKEELFKAVVQHRLISELRHLEDYSDQHTGTAEELLRHIIKIVYQRIIKTEKSKILFLMISEGKKFPELISYYHENVLVRVKNRIRKIILVGIERGSSESVHCVNFLN